MDRSKLDPKEYFHLRNDYVFKRVFNSEDTELLTFLVNSVLEEKVDCLTMMNMENISSGPHCKRIYQDSKVKDENGRIISVEM